MSRPEFVVFIAALVAVNALGVDLMLPALPAIGHDLGIDPANHRQWIITAYMFGFGAGQLCYGPLSDRFGRKLVLLVTIAGFVAASIYAAGSTTFAALLGARVLQGLMSASTRVLAIAITRDLYAGREMARTMSLAQMIFFLVPILAPAIGQLLLFMGPWRVIFYALGGYACIVGAWSALRFAETLSPARRIPLSIASLRRGYIQTLGHPHSIGYALASALTFGGSIAFVSSAQQIFVDEFGAGRHFTLLFAGCAVAMGCAAFLNSKLVHKLGTRLISQTALCALIALSLLHLIVIVAGLETLAGYVLLQALTLGCLGLCGANFGSMAMEPVGHIAGTASSIQGFVTTVGAVAVGSMIGQSYDGTTLPLTIGYACIGLLTLAIVYVIEGRTLFRSPAEYRGASNTEVSDR